MHIILYINHYKLAGAISWLLFFLCIFLAVPSFKVNQIKRTRGKLKPSYTSQNINVWQCRANQYIFFFNEKKTAGLCLLSCIRQRKLWSGSNTVGVKYTRQHDRTKLVNCFKTWGIVPHDKTNFRVLIQCSVNWHYDNSWPLPHLIFI